MYRIAWLTLVLAVQLRATTIVIVVTVHGIVLCADSHTGVYQTGNIGPISPSAEQRQKLFVIQNRFVVGHDGDAALYFGKYDGKKVVPLATPYFALDIINGLRRDASPTYSLAGIAGLLRNRLTAQFSDFDVIPRSGAMKREDGHPLDNDTITHFTIAGYDGQQQAHVYQVGVAMNWNTLTHVVSPIATLYPESRKNISLFASGYNDAIEDLWKSPNSPRARKFASAFPVQYHALQADLDLTTDQVVLLVRGLLSLQIDSSPTHVAYPLSVATIPASGSITIQSYKK
jgi:hypothetical protein